MLGFPFDEGLLMAKPAIADYLVFDVVNDALNLVQRFQKSEVLRGYVLARMRLVVPAGVLMVLTSLAFAGATVIFIGGTRPALVLLGLLIMPFVLLGSAFVQAYVFASWLEGRALAKALPHRAAPAHNRVSLWLKSRLGAELGSPPRIPWGFAAVFVLLPLAMLAMLSAKVALALIVLHIAAPILFARFDP